MGRGMVGVVEEEEEMPWGRCWRGRDGSCGQNAGLLARRVGLNPLYDQWVRSSPVEMTDLHCGAS